MPNHTTVTPGAKGAKPSPIKANTTTLSFDRRDGRQLGLPLTPADRANAEPPTTTPKDDPERGT